MVSAELWFLQRTICAQGLPAGGDGVNFIAGPDQDTTELGRYIRAVVEDQRHYHEANYHKLHETHKQLHRLSMVLFALTAAAILAHFVVHASALLICTAFFPALAAAIHGVATKLEIVRIAGQSAATERELATIMDTIDHMASQSGWESWLRFRHLALDASRIMSDENGQWLQLIRHQETELPA